MKARASRFRSPFLYLAAALSAAALGRPSALAAQGPSPTGPLTLNEAVEQALGSYPGLQAARHAAVGAEAAASGVAAARWPTVGLSTSAIRYQEPLPVTPIHGFTPGLTPAFDRDLFQGGTSLRYTIFDGLGRGARIDAAREESAAVALDATGAASALVARVSRAYLGVLGDARVLEAQDRRLAALEAERRRANQFLEVGRAAEVDVLRVESALAGARAERVSLAAAVEVSERELSRLTGLPVERTRAALLSPATLRRGATLEGGPPPRDDLLQMALLANPRVLREERRVAAADARGVAARSARWPKIDAVANYLAWASPEESLTAEWNAGVAVSVPLFTGGAVKNQVEASRAEVAAAREHLRLAESDVGQDIDRTLSSLQEAQARVESLTTAVARAEEVARIEQLRLDAGAGVQRDYLDAEAVLFANRAALVQARYGEIQARVTLAQITGELDLTWLASTLGGNP